MQPQVNSNLSALSVKIWKERLFIDTVGVEKGIKYFFKSLCVRPCENGKFPLTHYQNYYGN